ncbi:hypothetical protein AAC387_Pa10g1761 [Persea americana]
MSNHTGGDGGSFSSGNTGEEVQQHQQQQQKNPFHGSNLGPSSTPNSNGSTSQQQPIKKKRNLPGTPDPTAEVIALSPTTLMATNRFVCEICNKGFQRDQNLQLHRRGHNLPWKLRQRTSNEIRKRVYICPETTCVHHNPSRALGDLTGIKKHFCRKHGEKKWKCDKCSKKYAVQSDWKAHSKTCGTREYKCDCGTIFSRRDSFITHRAFCDALAEENSKVNQGVMANLQGQVSDLISSMPMNNDTNTNTSISMSDFDHDIKHPLKSLSHDLMPKSLNMAGGMFSSSSGALFGPRSSISSPSSCLQLSGTATTFDGFQDGKTGRPVSGSAHMSATALLQKAAQMGATVSTNINPPMLQRSFAGMAGSDQLSGMRSFGGVHQNISYDHLQPHTDQTQLVGIDGAGGFTNQFLQKTPQEIQSQFFDGSGTDPTPINDMGVFTSANGMFMGSDQQQQHQQHHMFLKNMGNSGVAIPMGGRNLGASRFGGSGGGDVMTVDFLGVGGTNSVSLHEQQQQQQGLEFEGVGEQRMQGMHQFHGQGGAMEKSMWDV